MQKSIYTDGHRHFLDLIVEARLAVRLTQAELATRLDTGQTRISDYERGTRRMDLMELYQYCQALGLPLSELVRRFEERVAAAAPAPPETARPRVTRKK